MLGGHCRDHFTFLPKTSKGDQKGLNLQGKEIKIIMAEQTRNPMKQGVSTVYPFFTLRAKSGKKIFEDLMSVYHM